MKNTGIIIIVDDDFEDLDLYKEALNSLNIKNQILLFQSAEETLEYLKINIEPFFFILCDLNMPKMNGLELREEINKDEVLRLKAIPFLFFSTSGNIDHVSQAYKTTIQGYFKKPVHFQGIQTMLQSIISYWSISLQPVPVHHFTDNTD